MERIDKNLRRLAWILKIFPAKHFYSVSAGCYTVVMQGDYNKNILKKAEKLNFKIVGRGYRWATLERKIKGEYGDYLINLTNTKITKKQ